jgi:hypothetical protein
MFCGGGWKRRGIKCIKGNIIMQQNNDRSVIEQEERNREKRERERVREMWITLFYWLFRSIWHVYLVLSEHLWKLTGSPWLNYALFRPTGNKHYVLRRNMFVIKTCIPFASVELSFAKLLLISQYITCGKHRKRQKNVGLKVLWSK